ncbi:hypothetical protein TIFTF001_053812 [Ficus carica]|uniref:Uncharacterized protein n=1 Tax=Ficus carica TaxID=3494 RepID=A0AA88JH65_FICCA|nr:hypothetical protein TIFTF001_053812 [Ficus carica]
MVGLDYGLSWKWTGRPNHSIVARPLVVLAERKLTVLRLCCRKATYRQSVIQDGGAWRGEL